MIVICALMGIVFNYILYALTGYPLIWCLTVYAVKPLGYYVAFVNLCMAVGIVWSGLTSGPIGAIQIAALMLGFNLVPSVLEALMGFGYRCV